MPSTVRGAFQELLGSLPPTSTQVANAKSHRSSIKTALDNAYGTYRFFESGSFNHGTGVRGHSDLDYFVSLKSDRPADSMSAANALKRTFERAFPQTTVRVRRPAVVIDFYNGSVEVTPGWLKQKVDDVSVYRIPSPAGGWIESAPDAHSDYVSAQNVSPAGGAKQLARLLKAWKYYRAVPVSSFYLEMRAARYMGAESSIDWALDMEIMLRKLASGELASMQDPSGLTGLIHACSSDAYRTDANSRLTQAVNRAARANEHERAGRIRDAFASWDTLFNGRFPTYTG